MDKWWAELNRTKPEPAIFWQFIEDHRNALLKEYRFKAEQRGGGWSERKGLVIPEKDRLIGLDDPAYVVREGVFKGQDQKTVVETAIAWWQDQLDEINTRACASYLEKRI